VSERLTVDLRDDREPWVHQRWICCACGYQWIAVHVAGIEELECKECGSMDTARDE
jgi:hypothetical protein